jgi:N-acetylmuramic acid 6-phosphate etherase
MIRLGRVEDNKMVNVLLINDKIIDRSVKMLMERAEMANYEEAKALLMDKGSVKNALSSLNK